MRHGTVLPDTPAGRRLSEFLVAVETATPETVIAFVAANYTPENAGREPVEKRIATFMDWKARGGFEILEITESHPLTLETVARQPRSDERWKLAIEIADADDHPVEAVLLGRAALPVIDDAGEDRVAAEAIVAYARTLAEADLFSGCVLAARHGEILAQGAFGLANRDFEIGNRIDTRFNVASLTKSWTAVAICQLVEAGRVSFDDPVSAYLDYPDAEAAGRITIKHLLSHTSGLGDYFVPEFDRTSRRDMRTVEDYLELCRAYKPSFAPGERWKYSNVGMVLLGRIIEIVTGRDYFEHVEDAVLRRAGMDASGFFELDYVNENTAVGYHKVWSAKGPRMYNSLFEGAVRGGPAGCGYAPARDIFRFAEAFKAGQLVSPAMAELMTTAKPELNSPDYGYGFAIHPERALYGHSGGLIGASSNLDMTLDPQGWVIVVLCNDLSMRAPVLKARQLIGVTVPEAEEGRAYLPRAGMTAR
ncbi:serine hydrolase domain-containing protein [Oricola sp.]|uniref:serine hydrolase domain-containing protein n=1 Tax=Oricola sp. TaxID=1979950 RepID=UPI0025FAC227|nr:serine hydrolase domain-containing protein [Oricola sp.]MCI5077465.1 beta-lactamase family protein [Oricola sp.]